MRIVSSTFTLLVGLIGFVSVCGGQQIVITGSNSVPGVPDTGYSAYGYPHFVLPGSDTEAYVNVWAEVVKLKSWRGNGVGGLGAVMTFDADNHFSVGDIVSVWKLNDNTSYSSWTTLPVIAATPTTFALSISTAGGGTFTTGEARKQAGKGFSPNGTWTIVNTGTNKTETYKLYTQDGSQATDFTVSPRLTGVSPYINLVVGPVEGDCKTTGSTATSDKKVVSPVEFDLNFYPDQDPAKSYSYHYVVCKNGGGYPYKGVAHATPGYRTVYVNRNIPLAGQVFGNTNQKIDWTIFKKPDGGNAKLLYADFPQPVFQTGSVAGKYVVKACPAVDHTDGACDMVGIYVSASAAPKANKDKVEQIPCEADPSVAWATVMDIGPSKKYKDLLAIPKSFPGPALFRVFNEGSEGKPTEYHNQLQLNKPTGAFSAENPSVVLCGVPNPNTGELPIVSGDKATSNSWFNPYTVGYYGQIGFSSGVNDGSPNRGTVQPFHHIFIAGLHLQKIKKGKYSYYDQNGIPQAGGNYGFRAVGVQYYSAIGNFTDDVAQPFFDDCNTQQNQWPLCSLDTFYEGNHSFGYGTKGTSTEHMFYLQAFRSTTLLNLQEGAEIGSGGTECYSDRGTRSFHMYNRCVPMEGYSGATGSGGHSEIQDAYNYVLPDEYFGYWGKKDCSTRWSSSPDCQGTFGGANWFAAVTEEHNNSDFVIGNLFYYADSGSVKYTGIETTHNTTNIDNSSKLFSAYNNFAVDHVKSFGGTMVEDIRLGTRGNPEEAYLPAVWPRSWLQNNIIPWNDNRKCAYSCVTFGTNAHLMMTFGKNMVATGQVTVATGLAPQYGMNDGIYRNGINQQHRFFSYANVAPIEKHLGGWLQTNFVEYAKLPYDSTTFVPQKESEAIGKAIALTGELSYYPPRFNAVDANMSPFTLRADLTTMGPYDPDGVTFPVSSEPPETSTGSGNPPPSGSGSSSTNSGSPSGAGSGGAQGGQSTSPVPTPIAIHVDTLDFLITPTANLNCIVTMSDGSKRPCQGVSTISHSGAVTIDGTITVSAEGGLTTQVPFTVRVITPPLLQ